MKTILIIEDQTVMRENLATLLELEGFTVLTAADGLQGLKLAQAGEPDLVLCDVMMPGTDGFTVLKNLRQDPQTESIPFIFLTAKGERPDIRQGMDLGADDYLTKPVSAEELLSAINARLERHRVLALQASFNPDFSSPEPLQTLGLTPREAEVLLWVAQGKGNLDISIILGTTEATIKKHLLNLFAKLGVETRTAASLRALEALSRKPRTP